MGMKDTGNHFSSQAFFFVGSVPKMGHSLEFCRKKNPSLQKEATKNRAPTVNRTNRITQQPRNLQATANTKPHEGVYKATGKIFTEIPTISTFEQGQQVDETQPMVTPTGKQVEDIQPMPTAQSPATKSQPSSTPNPPLCTANPFAVLGTLEEEDLQIIQHFDAHST
ncbi:hypothetical protein FRX31_035023 [Thalictrum thalictroides]|uniref:Uncharacterized protein n=1 Tax=Thalictrum thalictroides TaxID=46969 RepID=A0A7J6US37_THATH|nr:hypothetical protein FRX31_035023 [Thalictrum thalictroides]